MIRSRTHEPLHEPLRGKGAMQRLGAKAPPNRCTAMRRFSEALHEPLQPLRRNRCTAWAAIVERVVENARAARMKRQQP
jgi:hypothetical protein